MEKLTYINDQQIINDAAQAILADHLSWSGSLENLPSKSPARGVHAAVVDAYLEAKWSNLDEWFALSDEERNFEEEMAGNLYRQAEVIANKKWIAAMTLLGFEM